MLKLFLISLSLVNLSFGVDLNITTSDRDYATTSEIYQLKKNLLIRKIKIDDKEASRILEENMILSNLYLIENKLSKEMKNNFKILIEDKLAKMLIDEKEKNLHLSEDVLLSFYKDKKKLFFSKEIAFLSVYQFNDFDSALKFYQKFNNNTKDISIYAKDSNITKINQELEFSAIHPQIKGYLKKKTEMNYVVPPQKWAEHFIVVYLEKIKKEGYRPYEEIKEEIKKILIEENRGKTKKELVSYYRKRYGNSK